MNDNLAVAQKGTCPLEHITHELMPKLAFHAIAFCERAYGKVTGRLLFDIVVSIPYGSNLPLEKTKDTFFNKTHTINYLKGRKQIEEFENLISDEEQAAWDKLEAEDHAAAYLAKRADTIPDFERSCVTTKFLVDEYEPLTGGIRVATDLAFSGFLMTAVNDPNFSSLCKVKDIDPSSMTFEQKMDTELDHEALYRYLQDKLGGA